MPAKIPNIEPLIMLGIDPKTRLPIKMVSEDKCRLKDDIKKLLRHADEQDAVNRYKWKDLPANITSQELERMVYYKGQLCLFYDEVLDEFYFMPYTLNGKIDYYGRYRGINPVPFSGGEESKENKKNKEQADYLATKVREVVYKVKEGKEYDPKKHTVLLHDYTKQLSQICIPRVALNDPLLDTMSECIPYMRTALINSTGVKGVRVSDADQSDSVKAANSSMVNAALTGNQMVPIVGSIEFQELADGTQGKSEEYMLALQSLDNLRLGFYGIQNGGVFEKKSHTLESEQAMNNGPIELRYNDGLEIRKNFCEIANKVFASLGVHMSVEEVRSEEPMPIEEQLEEGEQQDESNSNV